MASKNTLRWAMVWGPPAMCSSTERMVAQVPRPTRTHLPDGVGVGVGDGVAAHLVVGVEHQAAGEALAVDLGNVAQLGHDAGGGHLPTG